MANWNSYGNPYWNSYPAGNYPQYQCNQPSSSMIWVNGEKEASAYPCAPGSSVTLWDSELPIFYIKSVDNSGMPMTLRRFKYLEDTPKETRATEDKKYLTMDDLKKVLETYVTKEEIGGA